MVFRRLSFERGFAPICRLKGGGSLGIEALGIGHWGGALPRVIGVLVYWLLGEPLRGSFYGHTVLRSDGLTFLLSTSYLRA